MSGAGDCAHALPRLPQEWPEVQQGLRRPWRKPWHSAALQDNRIAPQRQLMAGWKGTATLSLGSERQLRASRPFHEYCNTKGNGLGFARVSTVRRTPKARLEQRKTAGCAIVHREKVSGAKADCKDLGRLLKFCASGDAAVVTRIDPARLGSSAGEPSLEFCNAPKRVKSETA
jgi:hypothetical protein